MKKSWSVTMSIIVLMSFQAATTRGEEPATCQKAQTVAEPRTTPEGSKSLTAPLLDHKLPRNRDPLSLIHVAGNPAVIANDKGNYHTDLDFKNNNASLQWLEMGSKPPIILGPPNNRYKTPLIGDFPNSRPNRNANIYQYHIFYSQDNLALPYPNGRIYP